MPYTYLLRLIAHSLLICLFFQNCSNFFSPPLCTLQKGKECTKDSTIQGIGDKTFVAEGNHLVTFYEHGNGLKANVQVNPLDEVYKLYKAVEVLVEQGVEFSELQPLDKKLQQRHIQVQFSPEGKPKSIWVHKAWSMGGEFEEIITFFGNPGVGKSTLCNSIFQQAVFKTGPSLGGGMTQHKQEYIYGNKLYIDTPGLDDLEMRKQAALEIEKALKHNGNYKIVFVVTLESGRIKPADLVTINIVCDAIKTNFDYGIIFNKVTDQVSQKINQVGLEGYLKTLHKQPYLAVILKKALEIEDQDDLYLPRNNENRTRLLKFLDTLNAPKIEAHHIDKIDVRDFEEKVNDMEARCKREIAELTTKIEKQADQIKEIELNNLEEKQRKMRYLEQFGLFLIDVTVKILTKNKPT